MTTRDERLRALHAAAAFLKKLTQIAGVPAELQQLAVMAGDDYPLSADIETLFDSADAASVRRWGMAFLRTRAVLEQLIMRAEPALQREAAFIERHFPAWLALPGDPSDQDWWRIGFFGLDEPGMS